LTATRLNPNSLTINLEQNREKKMTNNDKFMHRPGLHFTKLVLFLLMMALPAMACLSSITGDDTNLEVTVALSEDAVNRLLRYSFVEQDEDNLFDDITSIDMQPGLIRMYGTYTHSDGSSVPGSADLTISAKDGVLNAEITAVDIAGLDIDHPRVTHINDVLTKKFTEEASENDKVEFVSVNITADAIEITVRVTPLE
jgi:hypothetical protein